MLEATAGTAMVRFRNGTSTGGEAFNSPLEFARAQNLPDIIYIWACTPSFAVSVANGIRTADLTAIVPRQQAGASFKPFAPMPSRVLLLALLDEAREQDNAAGSSSLLSPEVPQRTFARDTTAELVASGS